MTVFAHFPGRKFFTGGLFQAKPFTGNEMASSKNIRLTVAYDGSRYHGWQRQKNAVTIQGVLEDGIRKMTGNPVSLIASGRTAAGVHAFHQVCHFITRSDIPPESFRRGLNSLMAPDIFIREATPVPLAFHARYDAKGKTYEYRILNRSEPDIFLRFYSWHIRTRLDLDQMRKCLSLLQGKRDFSSFRSTGSGNTNPIREITRAEIRMLEGDLLYFFFEADGFLRHMVRNLMGTLVEVGLGRIDVEGFDKILQSKDRKLAGIKAPAQGLFLKMVRYE